MNNTPSKPRYFVAKRQGNGRVLYYWQPSTKLSTEGFITRRLSDNHSSAIQEANALNKELDLWRAGPIPEPALSENSTLEEIINQYRQDPVYTEKAWATQRIYDQCIQRISAWAGDQPVGTITRVNILDFHRALYAKKPAFANAIARMLRIIMEYTHDRGLIDSNPARRLKLPTRPPRHQIWSAEDQEKFLKTAHELGHHSMALAFLLGVSTAQRQGDILALKWEQFDGTEISLRQHKTGRWISVPALPELKAALASAPKKSEFIVCSEATKNSYKVDHFRHTFRDITKRAGLTHLQFRDLRRKAIVRLAEAGVSTGGITAISGHDVSHCENIIETYMPRSSDMARQAMDQYQSYRARKEKERNRTKSWK